MDESKRMFVVLAVQEYKQLKNKYDIHLKNIMEEEKRRRRILMSSVLRSTQRLVTKTETVGETETAPTSESNMAAERINIYLDSDMNMFTDQEMSTPFPGPLYHRESDPTTYYMNEDLTVMINMVEAEDLTENSQENDAASSTSLPLVSMPANDSFSKEQTLFLIDFMRQLIERKGEGLPNNLQELIARLKSPKGSKKHLWRDAADKLSSHFMQNFCPEKVARKWNTLVDAYKKIKENDKTTGKGTIRFQFYSEMDALLGGKHDAVIPGASTSHACVMPMSAGEGFNKEQTLFLIEFMRQHIKSKGEGLPNTLQEMNARLKSPRGSKKHLWKDVADKLASHFMQSFTPEKVARKWNTLLDAYKKIKENEKATGKRTIRFQFHSEMHDLLGGQNELNFPIVGTSVGLEVRKPEATGHCSSVTALCQTPPPTSTSPPCKRRRVDGELMQFLQDSEEASQRRHEETLAQLKSAQQGFEALMTKLLDKL